MQVRRWKAYIEYTYDWTDLELSQQAENVATAIFQQSTTPPPGITGKCSSFGVIPFDFFDVHLKQLLTCCQNQLGM